jgi:hypothetical protein
MKKIFVSFLILFVISNISHAQETDYGVGLMVGEPTGLSGKVWLDETQAVDFGIGAGFFGEGAGFTIHSDYLYHIKNLFDLKYKLPMYYGFGVRMRFPSNSKFNFGVRGVLGVMMYLKEIPVDVFLEASPSFRLLPTTGLDLDIAIGGRYYFKF